MAIAISLGVGLVIYVFSVGVGKLLDDWMEQGAVPRRKAPIPTRQSALALAPLILGCSLGGGLAASAARGPGLAVGIAVMVAGTVAGILLFVRFRREASARRDAPPPDDARRHRGLARVLRCTVARMMLSSPRGFGTGVALVPGGAAMAVYGRPSVWLGAGLSLLGVALLVLLARVDEEEYRPRRGPCA